jgi:hypothetical protein
VNFNIKASDLWNFFQAKNHPQDGAADRRRGKAR